MPSNDYAVSHLTQCMLLHYLWKSDQVKRVEINRKLEKTSPTLSIITWRKISRF